jgi:dTDP-4-dehydrorhamnose 3,5-epimerase
MQIEELDIAGLVVVTPPRFEDSRGHFTETFNASRFASAGIAETFVQDNQSLSRRAGTVRGLHCQMCGWDHRRMDSIAASR